MSFISHPKLGLRENLSQFSLLVIVNTFVAVGAIVAGIIADLLGLDSAIWMIAAITALSGFVVAVRMQETLVGPRHLEGRYASGEISKQEFEAKE